MTTGGMTTGHWHGTRKCTVSGAKIPRQQQVAGHRCPFCGHTLGAEFGRSGKATSLETQLDKLQKLHDDGVITDEELRDRRAAVIDKEVSAPPPAASAQQFRRSPYDDTEQPRKRNTPQVRPIFILLAVVVLGGIWAISQLGGSDGGSSAPAAPAAPAVQTLNAHNEVEGTLLGDSWIGSGNYALHAAAKAYNADDDFTAYAARVSTFGVDPLCLYWYSGGRSFGDGLTIGDTLTRQFSDWGAAVSASSDAGAMVRASADTEVGRAVIAKVGC